MEKRYQKWFPLLLPQDAVATPGDGANSQRLVRTEQDAMNVGDLQPCIQLELEWNPHTREFFKTTKYGLGVLHSISIAVIDSERTSNLLQATVSDVGHSLRHDPGTQGDFPRHGELDAAGQHARQA